MHRHPVFIGLNICGMHNIIPLNQTLQNRKSGQEVAKVTQQPKRILPKTHKDYWKSRLERRCYTENGKLCEVNEFSVRIQHDGRRKSVSLGTTNAETATIQARDLYIGIAANGWSFLD